MKKILLSALCLASIFSIAQKNPTNNMARQANPDSTRPSSLLIAPTGNDDIATGSLFLNGPELRLGLNDGRDQGPIGNRPSDNSPNRAMVHDVGDKLILNYGGDFSGGVSVTSNLNIEKDNFIQGGVFIQQNASKPTNGTAKYLMIGDDTYFTDANLAGMLELCGITNGTHNEAGLKLGHTGQYFYGKSGNIGINTTNPIATFHVNGLTVLGPDPGTDLMNQLNNCASQASGGTAPPLRLFANGTIGCTELRVNPTSWCDFVFDKEYKIKNLNEVEAYINTNKHLPDVPSEKDVKNNGVYVSEMIKTHMRKIEELTLYLIEQNKKMEEITSLNKKLALEISDLKDKFLKNK